MHEAWAESHLMSRLYSGCCSDKNSQACIIYNYISTVLTDNISGT